MRDAFGFSLEQYLYHGAYPGAAPLIRDPDRWVRHVRDSLIETTLSHHLDLLAASGMLTGLSKHAGQAVRRRGSSPKLQVLNTALMTAQSALTFEETRHDHDLRGRLVESAVGAHLANAAAAGRCEVYYWRERSREVDFVAKAGHRITAIEVKSGRAPRALPGVTAFNQAFRSQRTLLVGAGGIVLEEFLLQPVGHRARP